MWLKGGKERRMGWREDGMERGWEKIKGRGNKME